MFQVIRESNVDSGPFRTIQQYLYCLGYDDRMGYKKKMDFEGLDFEEQEAYADGWGEAERVLEEAPFFVEGVKSNE